MENGGIWRIIAIIVAVYFAIRLVTWLLHMVMSLLYMGIAVAVVVGIIWVLIQIFGNKKAYN